MTDSNAAVNVNGTAAGQGADAAGPALEQQPQKVAAPVHEESSMDAVRRWYFDYKRSHGSTPMEDLSRLSDRLDLTHAHPTGIAQLFASGRVQLSSLFRDIGFLKTAERNLAKVLKGFHAKERTDGTASLSLSVGIAQWEDHRIPVLLYPVTVDGADSEDARLSQSVIRFTGAASINTAFVDAMRRQGVILDADDLMDSSNYGGKAPETAELFALIRTRAGSKIPGFSIKSELILGSFIESSTLLLADSARIIDAMDRGSSPSLPLAVLAGDERAKYAMLNRRLPKYSPEDCDPHDELEAGDVSNATRYAAKLAAEGDSVFVNVSVIDDTAAQALSIASRVALSGKVALYVPGVPEQKYRFLHEARVNDMTSLLGDMSDPDFNAKLDSQLVTAVGFRGGEAGNRFDQLADELVGVRGRLNRYLGDLHARNGEWNVSAYQVIENLARISSNPTHPSTRVRLSADTVRRVADSKEAWGEKLRRAGKLGEFEIGPDDTPWYHASVFNEDEAVDAYQRVVRLLTDTLPAVREQIAETSKTCGFQLPKDASEWARQVAVLRNLRRVMDVFQPVIFQRDIPAMIEATKSKEDRKKNGTTLGMHERRHLVKEAKSLLRVGSHVDDIRSALIVALKESEEWRTFVPHGQWPVLPNELDDIITVQESLSSDLTAMNSILATTPEGADLETIDFQSLEDRLRLLYDDHKSLNTLPERSTLEREIAKAGLSELVDDLRARGVDPDSAPDEFLLSWWATVFNLIVRQSPIVANQDSSALTQAADRFTQVDVEHVRSIGPMAAQEMTKRLSETLYAHSQEANQLHTLLATPTVLPFTRLHKDFSTILRAARPILVAAPATLAAQAGQGRIADVAIIDASAHMTPIEVLTVLSRVDNVVFFGHQQTLSSPAIKRLIPYLAQVNTLSNPSHRDSRLTRFLSDHGYGDIRYSLSTGRVRGDVQYMKVDGIGIPEENSGIVESTKQEVKAVADIVEARAAEYEVLPRHYMLSIVCLTDTNRIRIGAELKSRAQRTPGLRDFLRHVRIVNITEVAGAAADDVIIACSFAKGQPKHMVQQFGVMEEPGSDGMLLDALALATARTNIVSTFSAEDMEDDRLRQPGTQLLKEMLVWCEHLADKMPEPTAHPSSDVIINDLAERIKSRGLAVETNYGFDNGIQIPLVVGFPGRPYRLAIKTDDAQFMSIRSLRQRYRFSVDDLRSLGWSVSFIWSVAAFVDPDKEVDRVVGQLSQLEGDDL
ncbi:helicase [Pseudoscardovia radai]|uniref:Helicase n=2 Tax=Pseudoscardovia radai TaxID=987066 RepID=A0A261F066_9BIFI|nr:helicase [Pseudoscardovia radai]